MKLKMNLNHNIKYIVNLTSEFWNYSSNGVLWWIFEFIKPLLFKNSLKYTAIENEEFWNQKINKKYALLNTWFSPYKLLLRNKTFCCRCFIGVGGKPALYIIYTSLLVWRQTLGPLFRRETSGPFRCICARVCVWQKTQGYGGSEEAVPPLAWPRRTEEGKSWRSPAIPFLHHNEKYIIIV